MFSKVLGPKNHNGKHGLGWHLTLLKCQDSRVPGENENVLAKFANVAQTILTSSRDRAYISFANLAKASKPTSFPSQNREQALPRSLEGQLSTSACCSHLYLSSNISVNYD